jgi:hypothetical protein
MALIRRQSTEIFTATSMPAEVAFLGERNWARLAMLLNDTLGRRRLPWRADSSVVVTTDAEGTAIRSSVGPLARRTAGMDLDAWPAAVVEFVAQLGPSHERDQICADVTEVRNRLKLRLYPDDHLHGTDFDPVAQPFAESLVAMLAIDLPSSVGTVHRDDLDVWGIDENEAWELAYDNLISDPVPRTERLRVGRGANAVRVTAWRGDSFFTASRLIDLEDLVGPIGPNGMLVAAPNRHSILTHPVDDGDVLHAVQHLIPVVRGLHRQGPGALSAHLYWWVDDELRWLPVAADEQTIEFYPPAEFLDAVDAVGGDGGAFTG